MKTNLESHSGHIDGDHLNSKIKIINKIFPPNPAPPLLPPSPPPTPCCCPHPCCVVAECLKCRPLRSRRREVL